MRRAGVAPSNYTLSVIAKLANRSKKPKMAFEMVEDLRLSTKTNRFLVLFWLISLLSVYFRWKLNQFDDSSASMGRIFLGSSSRRSLDDQFGCR